ncbi:MAG: murF, partial [Paenibacillus sp.]|nr:murF [Paenibacillus sp.]
MITRTLQAVEHMSGGTGLPASYADIVVCGASIDSRTVQPGNLFIPIVRQLDGHRYVEKAIANGAVASLWQTDHPDPPTHIPLIYVDDCLLALQTLAANYRKQLPVRIIGVTGSNGKTTTKDMLHAVMSTKYRSYKTAGNLNSQVGVALSLLEIGTDTEVAVIEMGMSERGQIARLSHIVRPDIAVITMIGLSHLASLGSREEIAAAKLEIIQGMPHGGVLVYNGDEPLLVNGLPPTLDGRKQTCIRFGLDESNTYCSNSTVTRPDGSSFSVGEHTYDLPLLGAYNVANALAVIAVAAQMGIHPAEIQEGFRAIQITAMRMEQTVSPDGFTIINDAWNASPVSMAAAIQTFAGLTGYARKHLVVADMLELGEEEVEYHREIGRRVNADEVDF